jgi:hypothetical protein
MKKSRQITLLKTFTPSDRIKLCHSRIPMMRCITGWLDSGLIAPLPIWSPVPEPYRRTGTQDDFSIWGLEAQHPKYLPEILKPFVRVVRTKNRCDLELLPGAFLTRKRAA